jgi:hypothetical protein
MNVPLNLAWESDVVGSSGLNVQARNERKNIFNHPKRVRGLE